MIEQGENFAPLVRERPSVNPARMAKLDQALIKQRAQTTLEEPDTTLRCIL